MLLGAPSEWVFWEKLSLRDLNISREVHVKLIEIFRRQLEETLEAVKSCVNLISGIIFGKYIPKIITGFLEIIYAIYP